MRVSQESGQLGQSWRGFRVKVNLPTFKDEKAKNAVTSCSWHWDMSVLCCSGWDEQCLLPYVFRSLQGFPGDLVRSLGKDATLGNVLQMLDEHYSVVMIFNTLSKDLYTVKQGIGENMTELRVCLSQQVQILQMEYPGRIQQVHVEEVKWDCSYEGLSPEYQQMLACKVDGENPVTNSTLLLTAWKVDKQLKARDPLLPKTTTTGGLNVTHSHPQGNPFPSRKLKGSHTFTAHSAVVEDWEAEEDSGTKPNGEEEAEFSAEEDVGMWGKVGSADQLLGYIVQFANTVELYKKKNHNCFGCGSPNHLVKDCQRTWKNCKEGRFKLEGMDNGEGRPDLSEVDGCSAGYPRWGSLSIQTSQRAPFLKPDPLTHWSGPENIAQVKINDERSWALLDSGSTINVVTPEFIKACFLDMGPLSNLVDGTLKINGFGGLFFQPLGYVIISVQVEGVKGYN